MSFPRFAIIMGTAASALLLSGCFRGMPSDKSPAHIIPDMDDQPRYDPQGESKFFADGSAMRQPVPGTVARGELKDNIGFYQGKDESGEFLKLAPVHVTMQLLERGQERFNIFCSPCHSRLGDGHGIMVQRGYTPPPTFHSDRIRQLPDGQLFDVITHGVRNMPSYAAQIPESDRWAIIAYLRALQRSQNASLNDVPEELRGRIR